MTYRYQVNASTSPKLIDVKTGQEVLLGVYQFEKDLLTICSRFGADKRPTAVWAEYGSDRELLVLRRIGEPIVEPDEKAIQGDWTVVSCQRRAFVASGQSVMPRIGNCDVAKGWRVQVNRHELTFIGDPPGGTEATGGGWPQRHRVGYALDGSKKPNAIFLSSYPKYEQGLYELHGDRLTILLSDGYSSGPRPKQMSDEPAEGQTLMVLQRTVPLPGEDGAKGEPEEEAPGDGQAPIVPETATLTPTELDTAAEPDGDTGTPAQQTDVVPLPGRLGLPDEEDNGPAEAVDSTDRFRGTNK